MLSTRRPNDLHACSIACQAAALVVASILLNVVDVSSETNARGGMHSEQPWAAVHIEGLPLDIRRNLAKHELACGRASAQHYFSLSLSPSGSKYHFVALHFEHFHCDDRSAMCTSAGCLHEVYVSSGIGYRLVFSARVQELELKVANGVPVIEISCRLSGQSCPRVLHWTGNAFTGR